jgi:hypothetical protein
MQGLHAIGHTCGQSFCVSSTHAETGNAALVCTGCLKDGFAELPQISRPAGFTHRPLGITVPGQIDRPELILPPHRFRHGLKVAGVLTEAMHADQRHRTITRYLNMPAGLTMLEKFALQ